MDKAVWRDGKLVGVVWARVGGKPEGMFLTGSGG
jgi:hypothetical protein